MVCCATPVCCCSADSDDAAADGLCACGVPAGRGAATAGKRVGAGDCGVCCPGESRPRHGV